MISSSTLVEVIGSGSFSGSFVGDGSGLTNIDTASYALTASYLDGFIESSSYALTASYALNGSGTSVTSSYALTASYLEGFVESSSYAANSIIFRWFH